MRGDIVLCRSYWVIIGPSSRIMLLGEVSQVVVVVKVEV